MATLIRTVRNETSSDIIIKIPGINPNNPLILAPSVNVDLFSRISADELEALQSILTKLVVSGSITVIDSIEETQIHAGSVAYSFNEIDTGQKWVDGKPIFRKCFTIPAQPNNFSTVLNIGVTIESLVAVSGFVNDGTNTHVIPYMPLSAAHDTLIFFQIVNNGTQWQIRTDLNGAHDGGVLCIEYTKA